MVTSLFLAQLLGVYMLIVGVVILFRRETLMKAVSKMVSNISVVYIIALLELAAGLALVIGHNVWVMSWPVIITIVGWLMVVESTLYLVMPRRLLSKLLQRFNKENFYVLCGLILLIAGAYLTAVGFSLL